ncbi:Protein of unknown function [Propionibacterium freudenreichii]|nr:Protein of unknown function [Propionibacterium freudenreichii]
MDEWSVRSSVAGSFSGAPHTETASSPASGIRNRRTPYRAPRYSTLFFIESLSLQPARYAHIPANIRTESMTSGTESQAMPDWRNREVEARNRQHETVMRVLYRR